MTTDNPTNEQNDTPNQDNQPKTYATEQLLSLSFWANNPTIEQVQELIGSGADVNAKGEYNSTALHYACIYNNNDDVVKFLLTKNINVNAKNDTGNTPLHLACLNYSLNIINTLLTNENSKSKIIANAQNKRGDTPLHYTFSNNLLNNSNSEILDIFIEYLNTMSITPSQLLYIENNDKNTILDILLHKYKTLEDNDQKNLCHELITKLITYKNEIFLNMPDTIAKFSIKETHKPYKINKKYFLIGFITLLISYTTNTYIQISNIPFSWIKSIFDIANDVVFTCFILYILFYFAKTIFNWLDSIKTKKLKMLLNYLKDANEFDLTQNLNSLPFLHKAVAMSNIEAMRILIVNHKYDINEKNVYGETPIFTAIRNKSNKNTVDKLIQLDIQDRIDYNVHNNNGHTILDVIQECYDKKEIKEYNEIIKKFKGLGARFATLINEIRNIAKIYETEEQRLESKSKWYFGYMISAITIVVLFYVILFFCEYYSINFLQLLSDKFVCLIPTNQDNIRIHFLLLPADIIATIGIFILYRIYIRTQGLANHFTHKRTALELFITMRESIPPSDTDAIKEWDSSIRDLMQENPLETQEKNKKNTPTDSISNETINKLATTALTQILKDMTNK